MCIRVKWVDVYKGKWELMCIRVNGGLMCIRVNGG